MEGPLCHRKTREQKLTKQGTGVLAGLCRKMSHISLVLSYVFGGHDVIVKWVGLT